MSGHATSGGDREPRAGQVYGYSMSSSMGELYVDTGGKFIQRLLCSFLRAKARVRGISTGLSLSS
jgi:hypothetical protein